MMTASLCNAAAVVYSSFYGLVPHAVELMQRVSMWSSPDVFNGRNRSIRRGRMSRSWGR